MSHHRPASCRTRVVLLLALTSLAACKNFKSSKRVDFTPFAEQTITSVSSLDADLNRNRATGIRSYLEMFEEEVDALISLEDTYEVILEKIVTYSISIVEVARLQITEAEKNARLASLIDGLTDEHRGEGVRRIPGAQIDSALENVRSAPTLLEGVAAAQPIVDTVATIAAATALELREDTRELEAKIDARLQADFAPYLDTSPAYDTRRNRIVTALAAVYRYENGEDDALAQIFEGGLFRDEALQTLRVDMESPDAAAELEEKLLARLERMTRASELLAPEYQYYKDLHRELEEVARAYEGEIAEIWGMIFVWSRAHEKMSRGVVDPAAWFDLSDAPSVLFKLARKAL
ncbi:MAG: hypothetical protein AAF957_07440 [Planctomycetota bacterium]